MIADDNFKFDENDKESSVGAEYTVVMIRINLKGYMRKTFVKIQMPMFDGKNWSKDFESKLIKQAGRE